MIQKGYLAEVSKTLQAWYITAKCWL